MKTIAIIPARGGSKRLPNKNILELNGHPLIAHSILYAQRNATIIEDIYVSTDDENIKKIALDYGAKVIDRPSDISGDLTPTITALNHVLSVIEPVENVVLLQVTNPLRPQNLLTESFKIYKDLNCESLFTVSKNHRKFGEISENKFHPFNYEFGQRSQDLKPLFYENGLLYIAKAKCIENNILISENAYPLEVNHPFCEVDIDTLDDFSYANYLIKNTLI